MYPQNEKKTHSRAFDGKFCMSTLWSNLVLIVTVYTEWRKPELRLSGGISARVICERVATGLGESHVFGLVYTFQMGRDMLACEVCKFDTTGRKEELAGYNSSL